MSADFDKFLKLEKRLFKLIDDPLSEGPTTSRRIMGKKERIRNKMRKLEPKIKGMKDGGLAEAIEKVKAKEMQGGGEAKSGGKAVSINTPTGRRKMAEIRKIMPGASVDEVKKFGLKAGILKMEKGGEVPAKFKGFSKLPESVQQKMNPELAEKFGMGGDVKAKKSGNICRGRGIARPGTGFTIR